MPKKAEFERVRLFRDGQWHFIDDLEGAVDVIQASPEIIRRHLKRVEDLLFDAMESQDPADVARAHDAFVAAMRVEGWLYKG